MHKWPLSRLEQSAQQRLYNRRTITPSGCWEWTGARFVASGYGEISAFGAVQAVHRVSWRLHHGEIPAGVFVLHRCDNRLCFNPSHLFLGDNQANSDDKIAKCRMRHGHRCGMANSGAKLDWDKVKAIRTRCSAGESTFDLAREFGVNQALIWRVWRHKSWRHGPGRAVVVMTG